MYFSLMFLTYSTLESCVLRLPVCPSSLPCTANATASVSESAGGTADVSEAMHLLLEYIVSFQLHTNYSFDQTSVCMSGSGKLSSPYAADVLYVVYIVS